MEINLFPLVNSDYSRYMNDGAELTPYNDGPGELETEKNHPAVPFSLDLGLSTVQGILTLTTSAVRIEWRTYDLFDTPKGKMQSLDINYEAISTVEIQRFFFGRKIIIVCNSPSYLQDIPLPSGTLNEMICTIKRQHSSLAELWAAEATLRLAEL